MVRKDYFFSAQEDSGDNERADGRLPDSLIKMYLVQSKRRAEKEIFVGQKLIIIYAMFYMHVVVCASSAVTYITFVRKWPDPDTMERARSTKPTEGEK